MTVTSPFDVDITVKNETDIDLDFVFDTVGQSTTVIVKRRDVSFSQMLYADGPMATVSQAALDQIHQRNKALDARNQKLEALLRKHGVDPDA